MTRRYICNMWSLDFYCICYSWSPRAGEVVYTYILHKVYRTYKHKRIHTYKRYSMLPCKPILYIYNASEGGGVQQAIDSGRDGLRRKAFRSRRVDAL